MQLTIREATNDDIEDVVRVIRTVYDEYSFSWEEDGYHADLYDLEKAYRDAGDTFYIAELDGKIVGTAALELFARIEGEEGTIVPLKGYQRIAGIDCSIERLYVHPDGRRNGVGRALFDRVINDAKAKGRTTMEIWSDKKFVDAHRLYERMGAKVVGERLCDDPEQSPEWGLLLPL